MLGYTLLAPNLKDDPMSSSMRISKSGHGVRNSRVALCALAALAAIFLAFEVQASTPFVQPKAEELAMKSVPGCPGCPAVVLYREEVKRDVPNMVQHYSRINAHYDLSVTPTPVTFTTRRHYVSAAVMIPVAEYSGLHSFYSQLQAKDKESVILKMPAAGVSAAAVSP